MNSATTISRRPIASILCVFGGIVAQTLSSQTIFGSESLAANFFSRELWQALVERLGEWIQDDNSAGMSGDVVKQAILAEIHFFPLFCLWAVIAGIGVTLAARLIRQHHRSTWSDSFTTAGFACGWWWLMGMWELAGLFAFVFNLPFLAQLQLVTPQFWQATALAGWLVQPFTRRSGEGRVVRGEQDKNNAAVLPSDSPLAPRPSPLFSTFVSRHSSLKSVIALVVAQSHLSLHLYRQTAG